VQQADVVLFVIDATEPLASQERTLAGMVQEGNSGVIIIVNKWDLVKDKTPDTMAAYERQLAATMPYISWAPVVFVSAITSQRIDRVFDIVDTVQSHRFANVSDEELDRFLKSAVKKHLPSRDKGAAYPRALGITQTGQAPPTFHLTIKAKTHDVLHPSYLRYLENRLREQVDLSGTPIRIRVKTAQAVAKTKT
jgi:GTP-binding protein